MGLCSGHAVAQNAGAIIKTLDEKPFLYGKEVIKSQFINKTFGKFK